MNVRVFIVVFLCAIPAFAQQKFEDFESRVPANWSTTPGSAFTLSQDHFQGGKQALKWSVKSGGQLTVANLAISASETDNLAASSARFHIYNQQPSSDTLLFQFIDDAGKVRRTGRMLLNFKGWRDYHRSYKFDYTNGQAAEAFALNQCRIIYRPAQPGNAKTLWLDEMRFIGDALPRFPGPHLVLDARHFYQSASTAGGDSRLHLINWGKGPDLPVQPATGAELAGLRAIQAFYKRPVPAAAPAALQAAKAYVHQSNISRNPDNSIKGRAITALVNQDTLLLLSAHCGSLARAWLHQKDADAKAKLLLFTEYLLDQGLAEGGRNVITTNTYAESRTFPIGFLEALPVYPADMRAEVLKMLKWSVEYSRIYTPDTIVRLNIDYIYVKSNFLFEIALADPSADVAVRDLKCIKRFFELNAGIGDGGRDGIKPDGVGVHHQSPHMSYLYAFGVWIDRMHVLKGTPFRISQQAYDNMRFAIQTLFLETSQGTLYSHSASGRSAFPGSVPVKKAQVAKLVEIGGDLLGTPFEPQLAGFYNYIFGEEKYQTPTPDLDGFYQFNYAQLGVLRKANWVATMRGFTDQLFGAEIYKDQNVYGRYQSYGTLEVLYDGSQEATGYLAKGRGWDWNVMPGTTTVHLPYTSLRPAWNGTRTEFQVAAFAGALAAGRNGVFGMDFIQDPGKRYASSNLTFRKSVFAFGDILVCLGSNINTSNALGNVATNLFQGITTGTNPAIYVNAAKPVTADSCTITLAAADVWLINGQTTGYYIPKGNGEITIKRGPQTTPVVTSYTGSVTRTANASKAWINHGTKPANASYHFVTVPAASPKRMQDLAKKFARQEVYQVLKQSNALHAVKYLSENIIAYVFFEAQEQVNIGAVKGISNKALVSTRESGDYLLVHIANPDLNTVAHPEPTTKWMARPSAVTLQLNGNWKVAENQSNATIKLQQGSLDATFILKQGFPATLKLVKAGTRPVEE